jgi:hypothetical protein
MGLSAWVLLAALQFNRDVRPILSDKCYTCHGPDAAAKGVPMRLDVEAEARPRVGRIVERITAEDAAKRMPPAWSGWKLETREIETLRAWVVEGAKWQKHWSFLPPVRSPLPKPAAHPIDSFVLDRLEREGLRPSPEAGREALIRRVSLDLTGLPPSPAEVDAFLRDRSPEAYEKVVDRLLSSPRYGERMAARWLDTARYADTNGYQYDGERVMWRWRDWVIDSFNRNQPYDQFIVEQIAGDLLPNAALAQKIATGFNRNHRANTEDGIVPEEYAVEYVVDRVETMSTAFLGLTLGCARCHNHKYDPFSQKEFYRLFAYFNNIPELGRAMKYGNSPPLVPAPTEEQQKALAALNGRIAELDAFLRGRDTPPSGDTAVSWRPSSGLVAELSGGEFDGKQPVDAGDIAGFDIEDRFTLSARVAGEGAVMSKMVDNPRGKGYGVYREQGRLHVHLTSNYADDAIRMESEQPLPAGESLHLTLTYTGSRMAEGVRVYVDGKPVAMKVLLDTLYRPFRNAGRPFREHFRIGGGGGPDRRFRGRIEDVRVWDRVLHDDEIAALSGRPEARAARARWHYLENLAVPEVREAWKRRQALEREREALERSFPTVMVMQELPERKLTHLLIRGAYDKKGEPVEPGVPAVLPPLPPGAANNRLGLAQWLVDPSNPLVARVAVNRFWQMYFGTGLVKTSEDFGSQGEWPSHPELLDWLATEFVRTGWDVKRLQKLIVMSATYRQSSRVTPELVQRDPENRLLARGPRVRLSAEMVRDQALAAAGLLVERIGGPSVKPYQPAGLWKETAMQDMDYVQSHGPDLYRRSLYTFWKRTIAPPMMVNFDAANREACVVRENRTNTPLQALNLMNDVTFVEAARFIGQRMIREGGPDPAARLRHGFRLVLARGPAAFEEQVLLDNLRYHLDYFGGDEKKARQFFSVGESPPDPALAPRDLAAYGAVASLILNLDEAVTKE